MSWPDTGSKWARRALVIGAMATLPTAILLATSFDLDHPLKRQESGVCNTGFNSLCLPYRFGTCSVTTTTDCGEDGECPQGETCNFFGRCNVTNTTACSDDGDCPQGESCNLRTASNLWERIDAQAGIGSTADAVVSISRYVKASGGLQTYAGGYADVASNFTLEKGVGYLVQVNKLIDGPNQDDPDTDANDFVFNITGSHDPSFALTLDQQCLSPGCSGTTSATGTTEFCQPYNMVSDRASELADEIDALFCDGGDLRAGLCTVSQSACADDCTPCVDDADCSSGETCQRTGVCTVSGAACAENCDPCESDGQCGSEACYRCACAGGTNDGELCIVESVSRFDRITDTLETFAEATADDFDLNAGEATRVQVRNTFSDFQPAVFDIQGPFYAEIEGQPPVPCGQSSNDGGFLALLNNDPNLDVRFMWHGGDEVWDGSRTDGLTNLVFKPVSGETGCLDSSGTCTPVTCPGPGSNSAGCEDTGCSTCGCEITDGMMGVCKGGTPTLTTYHRCDTDNPCPNGAICERKGEVAPSDGSKIWCNQTICDEPAYCTQDPDGACCDYNCCDQGFATPQECTLANMRCTPLDSSVEPEFFIGAISLDSGASWVDLAKSGVLSPDVSVMIKDCCAFFCSKTCGSCTEQNCPGEDDLCISPCDGYCAGDIDYPCWSTKDCTGAESCESASVCPQAGG